MISPTSLEVFVVTYNRATSLKKTLDNLCELPSWIRLTVLDNASTDNTSHVVNGFNPRVQYHKNVFNKGYGHNYLTALEMATADYVWVLGDDDGYMLESLSEVQEVAKQKTADCIAVGGNLSATYPRGTTLEASESIFKYPELWFVSCFVAGMIWRRESLLNIPMGLVYSKAHLHYPPTHILSHLAHLRQFSVFIATKPLVQRLSPDEHAYPSFVVFANWMEITSGFTPKHTRICAAKAFYHDRSSYCLLRDISARIVQTRCDWDLSVAYTYFRALYFSPFKVKLVLLPCSFLALMPLTILTYFRRFLNWLRFRLLRLPMSEAFSVPKANDPNRRI